MNSSKHTTNKLIFQAFIFIIFCSLLPGFSARADFTPTIGATMSNDGFMNYVSFANWPATTEVTLTIYDSDGQDKIEIFGPASKTTDSEGRVEFQDWDLGNLELQPGLYLEGTDGTTFKTLLIRDLIVKDVDVLNQRVTGTAEYPADVQVLAYSDDTYATLHTVITAVNEDGTWEADFSGASFELTNDSPVAAYIPDADHDSTGYAYSPPPPTRFVVSHDDEWIASRHWDYGTELIITIDDDSDLDVDPLWQGTFIHQPDDAVNWYPIDFSGIIDLQPGHFISVEGGGIEKIHQIKSLTVTGADPLTDIVYGTADPGSQVTVEFAEGDEWAAREVEADLSGEWSADFSEHGEGWGGEILWDIDETSCGSSFVLDQDGDRTQDDWCAAFINPRFFNNRELDLIDGENWREGTTVTMTIDDPGTPENPDYKEHQLIEGDGPAFNLQGVFDIQAGHVITMYDDRITKVHTVSSITIMDYDLDANIISGTAGAGDYIYIEVEEVGVMGTTADEYGNWSVDFGDSNIQAGDFVWAFRMDGGNDYTRVWEKIPYSDSDGDGFLDNEDNAPAIYNPDQSDLDGDGVGDVTDPCPSDFSDTCDPANSSAAVIGPDGGELTTPSGNVQVTIPANALTEEISISVTDLSAGYELNTDLGLSEAVFGVEVGPPGTVFDVPVTMVFGWEDADDDGVVDGMEIDEEELFIVKDGVAFTPPCGIYASCDQNANTTEFFVNSFSEFVLAALKNRPPTADSGGSYQADEGQTIILNASGSTDPDGDPLTYAWDLNGDGVYDDAFEPTVEITYPDDETYPLSVRVVDPHDAADTASTEVIVANVAPELNEITAPMDPVQVETLVEVSAPFSDPGADTWTGVWDWGDGSTSEGVFTDFLVSGSHSYTAPGVYTLTLTVADDDGGQDTVSFEYLVVYDPGGGFVTGGGLIDSPEGAYTLDPALTGKATFGFVSRYKKRADVPEGKTGFHLKTADFHFKSTAYQWLVIAGKQAKFKGEGEINGKGEYGFMISALDGDLQGGDGVDKFRIKIWHTATGEVVYDNQIGDAEDSEPTTALGGGSIVIHK